MNFNAHEFPESTYEEVARYVEGGHGLSAEDDFQCREFLVAILCGQSTQGMAAAYRAVPSDWAVALLHQHEAAFVEKDGRVRLVCWRARIENIGPGGTPLDTVEGSSFYRDSALMAAGLRARGKRYALPDTVTAAEADRPSRVAGGVR